MSGRSRPTKSWHRRAARFVDPAGLVWHPPPPRSCRSPEQDLGGPRDLTLRFELLLLNEGNGAAENRGVIAGQVNALSTFHTDERRSAGDPQQRLILLRAARYTAHRQFEDRACFDHEKFSTASSARGGRSICRVPCPMTDAVAEKPQKKVDWRIFHRF
jgi:hypothetical protein